MTGTSGWSFEAYLDAHPEIRDVLRERVKAFPEYESWLQQFGESVLPALDRKTQ